MARSTTSPLGSPISIGFDVAPHLRFQPFRPIEPLAAHRGVPPPTVLFTFQIQIGGHRVRTHPNVEGPFQIVSKPSSCVISTERIVCFSEAIEFGPKVRLIITLPLIDKIGEEGGFETIAVVRRWVGQDPARHLRTVSCRFATHSRDKWRLRAYVRAGGARK